MPFSLLHILRDLPIAVVDVETTGASVDFGHRIIELGIARIEGGKVVREYQQLIDPLRRISAGVTALTGITQQMVAGKPTFQQQLPAALELLKGAAIVGHNVRFDLSFLNREFRRSGLQLMQELDNAPVLDTVRIARRRFGRGGNGLQKLAPRLGVTPTAAHRALADAVTTAQVFERLLEPVGGWNLTLVDAYMHQGGPMGLLPASPRESLLPLELEEALDQRKPVVMEYVDLEQRRTNRVIEPLVIRRRGGELILIAYCQLRQAQRSFKLDRIVQLRRVEEVAAAELVTCDEPEPVETIDGGMSNDEVRMTTGIPSSNVQMELFVADNVLPSQVDQQPADPVHPDCTADPVSSFDSFEH